MSENHGTRGGICGAEEGFDGGTITIENVYSSGQIKDKNAGGIIGSIEWNAVVTI